MANEISTQLNKVQSLPVTVVSKQEEPVAAPLAFEPDKNKLAQESYKTDSESQENQESTVEKVRDKVSQLNEQMQSLQRQLQFTVDEESGKSVVTVRDAKTEEIIRQFPSEELLKARSAVDNFKGLLIEVDA
ncbi:flagellar protein FlaG [Pseudomonadota bacterium]|nr:flagellar protein FlaG [Pseudomonadota bacterium]